MAWNPARSQQAPPAEAMPGEVIVRMAQPLPGPAHWGLATLADASVKAYWGEGRYATLRVPPGREEEYRRRIAALPGVVRVERNLLYHPAAAPNDPLYEHQWNLPLVQAEAAWELTRGEGVIVAVLDTGVAFEDFGGAQQAPDLAQTLFAAPYDAVYGGTHPTDGHGHGTHVAGTVAQSTGNGIGAAGLAPGATVMPVRVCFSSACADDAIERGLFWAVDHGAKVINISLAGDSITDSLREALQYAEDHGVLVVAAAGNGGADGKGDPVVAYPAAVPSVLSVGAVRGDGLRAPYSNYGQREAGWHLDLVAPGGDLRVDQNGDGLSDGVLQNTFAYLCNGGDRDPTEFDYCPLQGTSMATPHVAAAAALVLSRHPGLSAPEVREALRCSARDLGLPGDDPEYGAGLVQAADALKDGDADGVLDCLEGARISLSGGEVLVGGSSSLRLSSFATSPGLGAFTIDIVYDPTVAIVTACGPGSDVLCNPAYGPGTVRLVGVSLDGLDGENVLADITFQATGLPGSASLLDVRVVDVTDAAGADLSPQVRVMDGTLVVGEHDTETVGDVDCDGDVDAVDALWVLRLTAGLPADVQCLAAGDADCDGDADAVDALLILRYVADMPVPPVPSCPPVGS